MTRSVRVVKVFYCYAREDRALLEELECHLEPLKRSGQIITWHDQEIRPGMKWRPEVDAHLNVADLILLLVSPRFMHSDNCYVEMERALERYELGEAHVVPIILHPVHWEETSLGELQALPSGGKPVTLWRSHHAAFLNIARGICEIVDVLLSQASKTREERCVSESKECRDVRCYTGVLCNLFVYLCIINWLCGMVHRLRIVSQERMRYTDCLCDSCDFRFWAGREEEIERRYL